MEVIETDYLILGAGTAGCVLADRLTEGDGTGSARRGGGEIGIPISTFQPRS